MTAQGKLVLLSALLFVGTALVLGILFHLVGLNSHGWTVLILLVAAATAIVFYRQKKPNVTAVS